MSWRNPKFSNVLNWAVKIVTILAGLVTILGFLGNKINIKILPLLTTRFVKLTIPESVLLIGVIYFTSYFFTNG